MKNACTPENRINLVSLLILLLIFGSRMHIIKGQELLPDRNPSIGRVQFQVIQSGHPWRPPFGIDRVGRSFGIIVTFESKEIPEGEFLLAGYLDGKEVSRKTLSLINKAPFTESVSKDEAADKFTLFSISVPDEKDIAFSGSPIFIEKIDQVALLFAGNGKDPVELARQAVNLPSFEAEAVARPDKVINPVDLGTILVPADWLLLAGGQKAYVDLSCTKQKPG